jgi:hypothetical protein
VEVPVKCIQGTLYVRISAHIYNIYDDYIDLADAIVRLQAVLKLNKVLA